MVKLIHRPLPVFERLSVSLRGCEVKATVAAHRVTPILYPINPLALDQLILQVAAIERGRFSKDNQDWQVVSGIEEGYQEQEQVVQAGVGFGVDPLGGHCSPPTATST